MAQLLLAAFVVISNIKLARFYGAEGQAAQLVAKAVFAAFCVACVLWVVLLSRPFRWPPFPWPLHAYLVVSALSIGWSVSGYSWIAGMGSLLSAASIAVLVLTTKDPPKVLLKGLLLGTAALAIASGLSLVTSPEAVYDFVDGKNRFAGVTYGAHAVARIGVLLFAAVMLGRNTLRISWRVFLAAAIASFSVALMSTYLADSRQAALLLLLVPAFLPTARRHRALVFVVVGLTAAFAVVAVDSAVTQVLELVQRNSIDDAVTLSSRTVIWQFVMQNAGDGTLGVGFGGAGEFLKTHFANESGWTTGSAHNSVLHAYIELGIFGAAAAIWFSLRLLRLAATADDRFAAYMSAYVFLLCLVEQGLSGAPDYLFTVAMVLMSEQLRANKHVAARIVR